MKSRNRVLYYGKKAAAFLASVLLLSVLVFYISRLAPGDPLVSYYGDRVEKMTPEERAWAEEKLGLNDPISVQYIRWAGNALHGDFGISYKYKMDVTRVIEGRIGNTLVLGGIGFLLIFTLALLLGILCAWKEDTWLDRIICKVGTITGCIPEFWLSLLLILVFSMQLKWLPSSGAYSVGKQADFSDRVCHLILPMTVVVLSHLWYYAYMIRNKILDEVREEYVLLARAKGLKRKTVLFRHCLRNTIPSYLGIMAISVPHVLGGTYIVETVFSYPGIGTLAYESARYKDYNLLMLLCLMSGIVVILCNMAAQIINERIDPRMREKESGRNIGGNDAVTEKTQLFQFAGERPAEKTEAEKRKNRYQDRPVAAELFLGLLVLGCLFCRQIMTKDPSYMDLKNCSVMPCREFLFGTDTMGRDIFSMIWYGGRISLAIGLALHQYDRSFSTPDGSAWHRMEFLPVSDIHDHYLHTSVL